MRAPVLLQHLRQVPVRFDQVDHVIGGVAKLLVGQRPAAPVGEAVRLVDVDLLHLAHELVVADRFAEAANRGGDLCVEYRVRHRP